MKKYTLYKFPFMLKGGKPKYATNKGTLGKLKENLGENEFIKDYNKYCPNIPYTPAILPKKERIIILGDIHGDYNLAIKMLKLGNLIDDSNKNNIKWIGQNTIVVQVGDQVDRCRPFDSQLCDKPNTTVNDEASDIKILNLFTDLDKQSRKFGGMVISLLGNHEIMNTMGQLSYVSYEGIREFENYKSDSQPDYEFESPLKAREYAFTPGNEYGKFLGCTRLPAVIIGSNLFVHAGIIDSIIKYLNINEKSDIETINIAIKKWLLGLLNKKYVDKLLISENSMFWTRILGKLPPNINMNDNMCMTHISNVLKIFKIDNLIVGHTPQSFLYSDGINSTCSQKVWRVDNGSSSAFHVFDEQYKTTGKVSESRKPQVLEILNDNIFRIIK